MNNSVRVLWGSYEVAVSRNPKVVFPFLIPSVLLSVSKLEFSFARTEERAGVECSRAPILYLNKAGGSSTEGSN